MTYISAPVLFKKPTPSQINKGGHGSQHVGSVIGLGNVKTSVSVSVIR